MFSKLLFLCIFAIYIVNIVRCLLSTSLLNRTENVSGNHAISSLNDNKTDVRILFEIQWENFVSPGPAVISLLGQLMLVSTKANFSLTENPPINGFKYIHHPYSFDASLIQATKEGWSAFTNSLKNMNQIQTHMQHVIERVKTAANIIRNESPNLVKRMLATSLVQINEIAEQCVILSAQTEIEFNNLILLLGEILECVQPARYSYDEKYSAILKEVKESTIRKIYMDNIGENMKRHQTEIDDQVKKYQVAYDKALKEIPKEWNILGQEFVRSMVNMVNILPVVIGYAKDNSGSRRTTGEEISGTDFKTANLLSIMNQFSDQIAMLKYGIVKAFKEEAGNITLLHGMFQTFRIGFDTAEALLIGSTGKSEGKSVNMIQRAKLVCTQLQILYKNAMNLKISEDVKTEFLNEVDSLYESSQRIVAAGAYLSNGMSIQSIKEKVTSQLSSGKHGNERFKAFLNLELLRDAQKRFNKGVEDAIEFQDELKMLMFHMANIRFEYVSFKDIIGLIKEGISQFAKIRKQWSKFTEFFLMMSVRTNLALNQTLGSFFKTTEHGVAALDINFLIAVLQQETVDIEELAHLLYSISHSYVVISGRFLQDKLAGLAKIIATSDVSARQALMQVFNVENKNAQNEINRICGEKMRSFKQLVKQRIEDVTVEVQQLGGPSKIDVESVRKGIEGIKLKQTDPSTDLDAVIFS